MATACKATHQLGHCDLAQAGTDTGSVLTDSEFDSGVEDTDCDRIAYRAAALGSKKAEKNSAAANSVLGFAMTAKINAGVDNAVVCRLFACVGLPGYKLELQQTLSAPLGTSIATKVANARSSSSVDDVRHLLTTSIRTLAGSLPTSTLDTGRWREEGTLLYDWCQCLQTMPPSVKHIIGQSFYSNDRQKATQMLSVLAILAMCERGITHDILNDLLGRVPTQFMRKIDNVIEKHNANFQQADVDQLVSLLLTQTSCS